MKLDHISHSQLNTLLRCGEQYRRRYLCKDIIAPGAAMVLGSSGHKAEEKNFKQKVKSKVDISTEEIIDCFSDEWESRKYEIGWNKEDLDGDSVKKAESKEKDRGISLVNVFHEEQAPLIHPAFVEQKFEVNFEGGYPKLIGFLDNITVEELILDYKFSKKSPIKGDIENDSQITAYDFGYRAKFGKKPKGMKKIWSVSTKVPKTVVQDAKPRENAQIGRFMQRLEKAMEAIDKEIFLPAQIGSWACSEKWCGYWNSCSLKP